MQIRMHDEPPAQIGGLAETSGQARGTRDYCQYFR